MSSVFHIFDFSVTTLENRVDLESKVNFLFAVKEKYQMLTPPHEDGNQYIVMEEDGRSMIKVFVIKLSDMVVYHKTHKYVVDMLSCLCHTTPDDLHDLTQEISTLAWEAAKDGLEKRCKFIINVDVEVVIKEECQDIDAIGEDEEPSFSGETCVVCMEEFSVGADVTLMPCSHIFHGECIVKWLENRNTCPLCRFEMPTQY